MRKSLFLLLFAALASAAIVSCSKEELQEKNQEENPIIQLRTDIEDPANSDNPYDYYGLVHNQAVEAYIADGAVEANGTDLKKVMETSNQLLVEKTDFNEYFEGGALASSDLLEPFVEDFPDNMEAVISAGDASEAVQDKLTEFMNHFLDATKGKEIGYDDAYDYIIDFESSIIGNKSWSAEDSERLLSATSIGRHSLHFWYTQQQTESLAKDNDKPKRKWWTWIIIGVADVGGGIVGASISGGTQTLSGAVGASNLANTLTSPSNNK